MDDSIQTAEDKLKTGPSSVIEVNDITKWYIQKKVVKKDGKTSRKQNIKAVDGVSFSLDKGEILGIIGESGCGKSTLGRVLIRLEEPTSGEIRFPGEPASEISDKDPLRFRRNCQMIFQNPFDTFDPRYTIKKILMSPLKIHGIGENDDERLEIVIKTMEDGGISPAGDFLERYPHELSGGQLQRISILRSMMLHPAFMVADEPVSMLDVSIRADIINMLLKLVRDTDTALVFISHDIATTRYISDRVAVMYLGRIVEEGRTDEVLHDPRHPYTKVLISNCGSIDPLEKKEVIKIEGEPPTPIDTGPGCYFAPRCYRACERCFREYPGKINISDTHTADCFFADEK